jgi:hypothetical protein
MPEQILEEQMKNVDFWLNELRSLGVSPLRKSELNDEKELQYLANNIKETLYKEYKAAYAQA